MEVHLQYILYYTNVSQTNVHGDLVKMQILIQQVWNKVKDSTFLISSQVGHAAGLQITSEIMQNVLFPLCFPLPSESAPSSTKPLPVILLISPITP